MCHIINLSVIKFIKSDVAESHQIGIILIFSVLCKMPQKTLFQHSLALKGKEKADSDKRLSRC